MFTHTQPIPAIAAFHVNLDDISYDGMQSLRMEFMASSGTQLLGYYDYKDPNGKEEPEEGLPTFTMDLTPLLNDEDIRFFLSLHHHAHRNNT